MQFVLNCIFVLFKYIFYILKHAYSRIRIGTGEKCSVGIAVMASLSRLDTFIAYFVFKVLLIRKGKHFIKVISRFFNACVNVCAYRFGMIGNAAVPRKRALRYYRFRPRE